MANPAREPLSLEDLWTLFHREGDPGRWLSMADSNEFLAIVTYIVIRNQKEADNR